VKVCAQVLGQMLLQQLSLQMAIALEMGSKRLAALVQLEQAEQVTQSGQRKKRIRELGVAVAATVCLRMHPALIDEACKAEFALGMFLCDQV
jgi:hypothetical protein